MEHFADLFNAFAAGTSFLAMIQAAIVKRAWLALFMLALTALNIALALT